MVGTRFGSSKLCILCSSMAGICHILTFPISSCHSRALQSLRVFPKEECVLNL